MYCVYGWWLYSQGGGWGPNETLMYMYMLFNVVGLMAAAVHITLGSMLLS